MSRGLPTLLLLVIAPAVRAQMLSFVDRWSAVSVRGGIDGASPPMDYYYHSDATSSFAPFYATVSDDIWWGDASVTGSAEQVSTLEPDHVVVHGNVYAAIGDDADTASAEAVSRSTFELTFDVDQATPVELTGHLYLPPGMGPPTPFGAHVRLIQLLGPGQVTLFDVDTEDTPFEFIDTLEAGRYFLDAGCEVGGDTAIAWGSTIGSTWFDFDLTVVPEPATGLLLVGGLALIRRR